MIGKWSGQLDRIIENHHIQAEHGQSLGNGQVNLTGSLRTITYFLRMDVDWLSQFHNINHSYHLYTVNQPIHMSEE